MEKSKVYFCRGITSENLIRVYEALGVELGGRVAVKVSSGEHGAKGYLKADLIAPLVKKLNGTIVECNTSYPGKRSSTKNHYKVMEEHGFTSFAPVDIMDGEGEMRIPVIKGNHLKYDIVGTHLDNYDCMLNLAHGKGHAMGGFGANLKNLSIGVASRRGKAYIHSAGATESPTMTWLRQPKQEIFVESMAEAACAVNDYFKKANKPIINITVMNYLAVDCDCDAHQGDPVMSDIGIIGSLDPVANDQAFVDFIWNSKEDGAALMRERIDSRCGRHILSYAQELGLGTRRYELVEL